MQLQTIEYCQFNGTKYEWKLSKSEFRKTSLVVGINSSGKSRTLNVIYGLSNILTSDTLQFNNGTYDTVFTDENNTLYQYKLSIVEGTVRYEEVIINGDMKLLREADGKGSIWTNQVNDNLSFKVPTNKLAAVIKRDTEQHPFLEPLHEWASDVVHVSFSGDTEKSTLVSFSQDPQIAKLKNNCIGLLKRGIDKFGSEFKASIILDMKCIGYSISEIGITQPDDVIVTQGPPLHCLYIKEEDLKCDTTQMNMSNGLFRALSLIIKINHMLFEDKCSVLIVDDIGEGLDFKRAKGIVDMIISKTNLSKMQVIMSTNDQFIMNGIPLEYWSITKRDKSTVSIVNKYTHPEKFDEFEFIGLNNFEFFSSEYYLDI